MRKAAEPAEPGLAISLAPLVALVFLLVINVLLFKDGATGGPNQVALLLAGVVAAAIGCLWYKVPYQRFETEVIRALGMATTAIIILLVVGALIGIWIMSGVVPSMIYFGLKTLNPTVFLPLACIICAIVSITSGSSWSTSGTVGIALIGVGTTLRIPEGMVAGAVISGAYFGDKMSPLSDTTNMAPAVAGTDIFSHIRHMLYTTIPAFLMALIGFSVLSLVYGESTVSLKEIETMTSLIEGQFNVSLLQFLVPGVVLVLIARKVPALPSLTLGTLLGVAAIFIFQQDLLTRTLGAGYSWSAAYKVILETCYSGFKMKTDHEAINTLFSKGGMEGMLSTLWLILSAMVFGGAMEASGMLGRITQAILSSVKKAGSLVGATLFSCLTLNLTASDQYLAIVVPGNMFKNAYLKFGLHPKNLSRSLEDAGTVTSVLIPWNSGGAYHASVLGVPTLTYLPYCFFNLLSPLVSLFIASMGWTIEELHQDKNHVSVGPDHIMEKSRKELPMTNDQTHLV